MDSIKKVPVDILIEILTDLYEKGVNYIDIIGNEDELITKMTISVIPEYIDEDSEFAEQMMEEANIYYDEYQEDFIQENPTPFIENDLNDLI
jgi:hypothetical protein